MYDRWTCMLFKHKNIRNEIIMEFNVMSANFVTLMKNFDDGCINIM